MGDVVWSFVWIGLEFVRFVSFGLFVCDGEGRMRGKEEWGRGGELVRESE